MSSTITGIAGSTAGASAGPRLSADLNTFLRLLTTQLRNQDPTSPMDADRLTEQLVQFSTVEQQVNTNQTLQQMLALQQAGQLGEAAGLVGRRVAVETDALPLQSGRAEIGLPAAGAARMARIEVRDAAGTVIRRSDVTLGPSAETWRWDGADQRGAQRPDGAYRVAVTGLGSDGANVALGFTVQAQVTGATREGGAVLLRLGSATVAYDKLRNLVTGG